MTDFSSTVFWSSILSTLYLLAIYLGYKWICKYIDSKIAAKTAHNPTQPSPTLQNSPPPIMADLLKTGFAQLLTVMNKDQQDDTETSNSSLSASSAPPAYIRRRGRQQLGSHSTNTPSHTVSFADDDDVDVNEKPISASTLE
jgi:hypothetical protein